MIEKEMFTDQEIEAYDDYVAEFLTEHDRHEELPMTINEWYDNKLSAVLDEVADRRAE